MKKNFLSILVISILCLNALNLSAQDKKMLISDPFTNIEVYPSSMRGLQWMGDADAFTYNEGVTIIKGTPKSKKTKEIANLSEINDALEAAGLDKLTRMPNYTYINSNEFYFTADKNLVSYSINDKKIKVLNTFCIDGENHDIETENFNIAYTKENNVYILKDKKEVAVTNDTDKNIVNGTAVHRVEFGIEKGLYWSPNGEQLAFYRKDESMVTNYPLVDVSQRIAELDNEKYPMAGMKSHHVTLGVYNIETGKTTFVKTGTPAEQYLTSITWTPDSKYILIAVLNRDQNHMKLNKYDANTGEFITTLFEEQDEKYVEPEHGISFIPNNPNQFIWFSEKDGFDHMYLYNIDGNLVKQITKGEWVVKEILGYNTTKNLVIFSSTMESPLETNIYSVSLDNGEINRISKDAGTHYAELSGSGNYIIDNFSSLEVTNNYYIEDLKGKVCNELLVSDDPFDTYNCGDITIGTLKATDGTDLYYRLITPADYDPNKKYPALIYVYGGPHAQMITNSWTAGAGYFLMYLAQQGYVVMTVDNRGSANRGKDFEQAIFRNCGSIEVEDQMLAYDFLTNLDYVDTERIGIDGWSYGGFMSISTTLKNPGKFKVSVAGGPVIDWKWYEIMYGERYMDTPQTNEEGYENSSVLNHVSKKNMGDTRMLVIHGTEDPTVVWQHSLSFVQKCIEEGVMIDYMVYPGHGHNVGGYDRLHLFQKKYQFLEDFLKN